jgi:phosphatidylcholine synthase
MSAWLVHLYTASSALFGFLALTRIFYDRYRDAFIWLALALFIDATDGALARLLAVRDRLPHFDGAKLDDIVDYITYVFVPAFFVWHALLVPERWSMATAAAMLLSSAYGFNTDQAKTSDHFFTGFPSYWNIVVFYLFLGGWAPEVNLIVLLVLSALVFVPIRYVYPSRTSAFRRSTNVLGAFWGVSMIVMIWQMPDVSRTVFWISLAFPAYYVLLSLVLEQRRRSHQTSS